MINICRSYLQYLKGRSAISNTIKWDQSLTVVVECQSQELTSLMEFLLYIKIISFIVEQFNFSLDLAWQTMDIFQSIHWNKISSNIVATLCHVIRLNQHSSSQMSHWTHAHIIISSQINLMHVCVNFLIIFSVFMMKVL